MYICLFDFFLHHPHHFLLFICLFIVEYCHDSEPKKIIKSYSYLPRGRLPSTIEWKLVEDSMHFHGSFHEALFIGAWFLQQDMTRSRLGGPAGNGILVAGCRDSHRVSSRRQCPFSVALPLVWRALPVRSGLYVDVECIA